MKLPTLAQIPAVVLLISACSLAPLAQPTSTPAPPVAATPTAAAGATVTPAVPVTPTVEATHRPPVATDPPLGLLDAGEGPVEGWLGSYCWQGACADAAGIPPKGQLPNVTTDGGDLEFSLSDGATFVRWRATYAAGANDEPKTIGEGGEAFDPDARPSPAPELLSSVAFDEPPAGDWIVFVQVFFDGGDLSYAWNLIVR